jgi:two-component system chemotaxis sensor kinase CheA
LPTATHADLEKALFADFVSTRDEASATSGRGVGMGAVLACVQARGGLIDVETARGVGTTWVFRFPLAMLSGDDSLGGRGSKSGLNAA